jgi:O-antigen/teichoic acid export membrane protein
LIETAALYLTQIALLIAGFGIWALIVAQLVRSATGLASLAAFAHGLVRPRLSSRVRSLIRRSVAFQGPAVLTGTLGLVVPLIVISMLGTDDLGLWSWSVVFATPLMTVLIGIHAVAMPTLARMSFDFAERSTEAASLMSRATVLIAASGAGTLFGFAPQIVPLLFGERWTGAVGAVQASLVGVIPAAFSYSLAAVVDSRSRPGARLGAALTGGLVGVVALFPLASAFGVTGAAVASGIVVPAVDAMILARIAAIPLRRAVRNAALVGSILASISLILGPLAETIPVLILLLAATTLAALGLARVLDPRVVLLLLRFALRREGAAPPNASRRADVS